MKRVLVACASKYGATHGIAEAIGTALADAGLDVDVRRAEEVSELSGYDAVVLGSAVYMGRWLEPARELVETHSAELDRVPTWLFSSGPIGNPLKPSADDAVKVDEIVAETGAREHVLFAGKLDKSVLRFGDRAVATAFRAAEGDFRDWDEIAAWARAIADDLARSQ